MLLLGSGDITELLQLFPDILVFKTFYEPSKLLTFKIIASLDAVYVSRLWHNNISMMTGLHILILLGGVWSISQYFFRYRVTRHPFYLSIIPTNICFWLFVAVPLLTVLFIPTVSSTIIALQTWVISAGFLMVIPPMVEQLSGRRCYPHIWTFVGGVSILLHFVGFLLPQFAEITILIFTCFYFMFFVFMGYIRLTSPMSSHLESIYLSRFFLATIGFLPGIFLDITGLSQSLFHGIYVTPWFYLSMIVIGFSLPEPAVSSHSSTSLDALFSHYQLTKREKEIAYLLMAGKSNQAIADELVISLSTAKRHVHHIFQKCNVEGRFEFTQTIQSQHPPKPS